MCPGTGTHLTPLFFESTPLRQGFRDTDVDMAQIENQEEGDFYVGWIHAGEWLRYTVNVLETGEIRGPPQGIESGRSGQALWTHQMYKYPCCVSYHPQGCA